MVSKSQLKLITSLRQKKYRDKHQMFLAEGPKVVGELSAAGFKTYAVFATEPLQFNTEISYITETELKKISSLKTPNKVLAIFYKPTFDEFKPDGITLLLDGINDPGNLGTIIRLCDWFGITNLVCSNNTVDCYNPKVVQATMGSIARVQLYYKDLPPVLELYADKVDVYGAFMKGTNVYRTTLSKDCFLVMGNEANGISPEVAQYVTQKISIPQFGNMQQTESLNVATATAILLSEIKRTTEM